MSGKLWNRKVSCEEMVVLIAGRGFPELLGMPLDLRHGAVEERGHAPSQKFLVAEENRDKNTDKMAWVSRE